MKFQESPLIVLVPYPAQGHVTPMLQLATALCRHGGFRVAIVVASFIYDRIIERFEHDDNILLVSISDGLGPDEPRDFFTIDFSMENCMPNHLEGVLRSFHSQGGVACVIADLLASWVFDVSGRCGIPVAGFWPAMMATYNLISAIPHMIRTGLISESGSPMLDTTQMSFISGQPMLSPQDLPWLVGNSVARKARFSFWLKTIRRSRSLPWLLVNSFSEEAAADDQQHLALEHHHYHHHKCPRVFQVGPLTGHNKSNPSFWEEDRSCLEWLSNQNRSSVVYVSFGSWVGPIGEAKIRELATGLEAAKRPFLWVLGPAWRAGLPAGYLGRVSGLGKVVAWAPQREVLEHPAVGCFLTHCGWNSTLEAIECGKPMVCYPVSGDQFMNCNYIVNVWMIGVRLAGTSREAVEEGVGRVMIEESGEMKRRVVELKERISREDGGGNSRAVAGLTAFLEAFQMMKKDNKKINKSNSMVAIEVECHTQTTCCVSSL